MEFNYFKTSVMSAMAVGAFVFSASATAAAPVSVLPEQGTVKSLETLTLVFNEGDEVAWTAESGNTPYFTIDGEIMGLGGPRNLSAEGNKLSYNLGDEWITAGEYKLIVPAGTYSVNGEAGEACTYTWTVTGIDVIDYSVSPATSIVDQIRAVVVSFKGIKNVTLSENLNSENAPRLYLVNEDGTKEARDMMMPSVNANNLVLTTYREPITEPGYYLLDIPGTCYFLDNAIGYDIQLNYQIIEDAYPVVNIVADPAEGVIDEIETINVTLEGVQAVKWNVTGTENAPYFTNMIGERFGTFSKVSANGNTLSMTYPGGFNMKGNYRVVIPEGSYSITGEIDVPGKQIVLDYDVIGLSGYTVEPEANILSELQNFRLTFHDAKEVTLPAEMGTHNSPYLDLVTPDGIRERRATLMPSVVGNSLILKTYSVPVYEPGDYILVIPAGSYLLDGKDGELIELNYTVVEPSYPEVELSVNPATDKVETIDTIEITFGGVDIVEWAVTGTENSPYLVDLDGNRWATFTKLGGEGNMLSLSLLNEEFTAKGEYKVVIPEGSYVFQGIYHGMPGEELTLSYEVLGLSGLTVVPSESIVSEIQYVTITFNEAKDVTLAEDLSTEKSPILYLITEDGVRERRGTMFPSVSGNTMNLRMNSPIYDEGEYVIVLPGSVYFLDGNEGKDEEFYYTVVAPSYPEIELSVNPATDIVEAIETVEVTFGGVDLVEWAVTGTENAPYLADLEGNRFATFYILGGQGNMLSMSLREEFATKGEYQLIIPEGAYTLEGIYHGMPGKELSLKFEILGYGGYSVEPANNIVSEIQFVTITFNDVKEVTLSEDLGTMNTPVLYLMTEQGLERRGTLFPSASGNKLSLRMNSPIADEGEYVVSVPGSTYFLDGAEGFDIELTYIVVGDMNLKYTVEPAEGTVTELHTFAVAFDSDVVSSAIWNVSGMEENEALMPTLSVNGGEPEYLTNLYSDGSVLSLTINSVDPCRVAGYYVVTIPAGSYYINGNVWDQEIILAYNLMTATAVDAIFGADSNIDVYDINGRVVVRNANAETLKALRGVYVINGKKYILN